MFNFIEKPKAQPQEGFAPLPALSDFTPTEVRPYDKTPKQVSERKLRPGNNVYVCRLNPSVYEYQIYQGTVRGVREDGVGVEVEFVASGPGRSQVTRITVPWTNIVNH